MAASIWTWAHGPCSTCSTPSRRSFQSRFELAGTRSDLLRLDVDCLYSTGALRTAFGLEGRNLQGVEIQP